MLDFRNGFSPGRQGAEADQGHFRSEMNNGLRALTLRALTLNCVV
jgi:hypothetical protein